MMKYQFIVIFSLLLLSASCNKSPIEKPITTANDSSFVRGADISWLPQMEASGYTFYDNDGTEKDCLTLLKARGINTVRLRVWVNPSNHPINGHCSKEETVALAVRAKNLGMRVMINFHYSDSWADPGKQTKPAAWVNADFQTLKQHVYDHTFDVLTALFAANVVPEWVQIGNEIPSGMLWPDGNNTGNNFGNLVQLINSGYDATKAVNSAIKVIVHIDKGHDNARFRWFFDGITNLGAKFDIIGASYYPYWIESDYTATIDSLGTNLNDMASRYNKEVMIVEVGGDYLLEDNTFDMLKSVITKVKNIPNKKGLGVIYWEPEGAKSWSGYQLSAWRANGQPSIALDAFKE